MASTTADALLREAHDRGYRFPARFDGFTARIGWETPTGSGEGTALVCLGIETPVETSEIDEWATGSCARSSRTARRDLRRGRRCDREARDRRRSRARQPDRARRRDALLVPRRQRPDRSGHAHGARVAVHDRRPGPHARGDGTSVPTTFCVAYWDGARRAHGERGVHRHLHGARRRARPGESDRRPRRQRRTERPAADPLGARSAQERGGVVKARLLGRGARSLALAVVGGASGRTGRATHARRDGPGPPHPCSGRERQDGRDPEREPDRAAERRHRRDDLHARADEERRRRRHERALSRARPSTSSRRSATSGRSRPRGSSRCGRRSWSARRRPGRRRCSTSSAPAGVTVLVIPDS